MTLRTGIAIVLLVLAQGLAGCDEPPSRRLPVAPAPLPPLAAPAASADAARGGVHADVQPGDGESGRRTERELDCAEGRQVGLDWDLSRRSADL
jgi:hypothetical protein